MRPAALALLLIAAPLAGALPLPGPVASGLCAFDSVTLDLPCGGQRVAYEEGTATYARGLDLAAGAEGAIFVSGYQTPNDAGWHYVEGFTVAYPTPSSAPAWRQTLPGGWSAVAVAVSPDGATTYSAYPPLRIGADDAATGERRYLTPYILNASGYGGTANELLVTSDGALVLAAGSFGKSDPDAVVVAHHAPHGGVAWMHERPAHESSIFAAAHLGPGDALVAAGSLLQEDRLVPLIVALEPDGQTRWTTTHTPLDGREQAALRVAWSPDGSRVVLGGVFLDDDGPSAVVWMLDGATGATLWARDLGIPSESHAWDVAWSPDGDRAYAQIFARVIPGRTAYTYAFDAATGDVAFQHRHAVGVETQAIDLVATSDGALVIAAGLVHDGASLQGLAYALDARLGVPAWETRDGSILGQEYGTGLETSRDGSLVHVMQHSYVAGEGSDVVILTLDARTGR